MTHRPPTQKERERLLADIAKMIERVEGHTIHQMRNTREALVANATEEQLSAAIDMDFSHFVNIIDEAERMTSQIQMTVEVSANGTEWKSRRLVSINEHGFTAASEYYVVGYAHCRVPYSCPDPIAELSEAADLLAERGADYAASMLLNAAELLANNERTMEAIARGRA